LPGQVILAGERLPGQVLEGYPGHHPHLIALQEVADDLDEYRDRLVGPEFMEHMDAFEPYEEARTLSQELDDVGNDAAVRFPAKGHEGFVRAASRRV
jgi:hypothetical protein